MGGKRRRFIRKLRAKNLPRARECVLRVFTAIRVAEGAARSVAVSPYRFLCNYNQVTDTGPLWNPCQPRSYAGAESGANIFGARKAEIKRAPWPHFYNRAKRILNQHQPLPLPFLSYFFLPSFLLLFFFRFFFLFHSLARPKNLFSIRIDSLFLFF